jgi:hypothetical protein
MPIKNKPIAIHNKLELNIKIRDPRQIESEVMMRAYSMQVVNAK